MLRGGPQPSIGQAKLLRANNLVPKSDVLPTFALPVARPCSEEVNRGPVPLAVPVAAVASFLFVSSLSSPLLVPGPSPARVWQLRGTSGACGSMSSTTETLKAVVLGDGVRTHAIHALALARMPACNLPQHSTLSHSFFLRRLLERRACSSPTPPMPFRMNMCPPSLTITLRRSW